MPIYKAPIEDFKFLSHEVFDITKTLSNVDDSIEISADLLDAILIECGKLSEEVLFPLNQTGDELGCKFANGEVFTPPGFKDAYKKFSDGGWCGLSSEKEFGGQGLPEVIQYMTDEMISSANMSFGLYPGLTQGTILCISKHGSEEQKEKYLSNLISGKWQGTMCLTESHAGSDLGLLRTQASPNDDGTFSISGTKIFISAGEHDMVENIVHLVLARLPDAPKGTSGISMFIVPKFKINDDGSLGKRNSVSAGSIEHKMGAKASSTCVMNFDNATGWLIGIENKGLSNMFTMMNKERLFVGTQGIAQAEISFQNAKDYANERLQGRAPDGGKSPDKPADAIINHPDIKNKLLFSKSIIQASRALSIWTHLHVDLAKYDKNPNNRTVAEDIEGIMTPVIKASCTDFATEITNECLQIFGGHGYVSEWGMEQFVRDVRITQIYEGTNSIQALDLVTRKLKIHNGRLFDNFINKIETSIVKIDKNHELDFLYKPFKKSLSRLIEITEWIKKNENSYPHSLSTISNDYLKLFSLVCFAWMWLLISEKCISNSNKEEKFYKSKLKTANFFMHQILPLSQFLENKIRTNNIILEDISVNDI
ncbi:MAG: hypothetical protein CBC47_04175 [Alphaproteobacteria bacterium TMED87]|nr:acyl-CoA dehydrogenase [Rhodospirillaceae bacterium]OUV09982.1 MAG: hypothetical protein CBC47_04175 [Alphaproteobacteria bacterium TMED87]